MKPFRIIFGTFQKNYRRWVKRGTPCREVAGGGFCDVILRMSGTGRILEGVSSERITST